jgi:tryptophan 2,3-dioxygenase
MTLTYATYLKLDELLALQEPKSDPVEHDEMLFIVIHQVYELWFKQVLWELEALQGHFSENEPFGAVSCLKRVRTIMKTLVGQLDILETMTPMSFSAFRDRLETSSGFQSAQFRELEFLLGLKRKEVLGYFQHDPAAVARLERRLAQRSLVDCFYDLLQHQGLTIPARLRAKDVTEPTWPDETVQQGLLQLYARGRESSILFELMLDVDEGLQEWRYRHVKIVERTIGNKQGTGGSLGVEFLKRSLFQPVFPDLWAVRHAM